MIEYHYTCNACGDSKTNQELESFSCACGGDFKIDRGFHDQSTRTFEPHYDRVLRSWVSSERDKERKMKRVKNSSHPNGIYNVRDDKKFMAEQAYIQKHREEFKAKMMPGYKPRTKNEIERQGEHKYDPNRPDRYRPRRIFSY